MRLSEVAEALDTKDFLPTIGGVAGAQLRVFTVPKKFLKRPELSLYFP